MNIKVLFLVFVFLSSKIPAIAQSNPDNLYYVEKSEKYRRMKNGGAVLTILGGVLVVAGIGTMLNSIQILAPEQNDEYKTGQTLFMIGATSLGPGIPLWIIGTRNHRKYDLGSASVRLNLSMQNTGLSLRYRF